MDKLKIFQRNCRGLNNKISDLISFSTEEEIVVICLSEIKSWKKQTPSTATLLQRKPATTVIIGSAILVKNSIVIKRIEPVEKETDSNGRTLEALKICLKLPSFDDFWMNNCLHFPWKAAVDRSNVFRKVEKCLRVWRLQCSPP